jgi:hypothetical protein
MASHVILMKKHVALWSLVNSVLGTLIKIAFTLNVKSVLSENLGGSQC